jgi:hypothetical protein
MAPISNHTAPKDKDQRPPYTPKGYTHQHHRQQHHHHHQQLLLLRDI